MSAIYRDLDGLVTDADPQVIDTDPLCSFCGNRAHANWRGEIHVFVCRECAVHVLPCFAADALAGYHLRFSRHSSRPFYNMANFDNGLRSFAGPFWRAVACAIARRWDSVARKPEANEE